MNILTQNGKSLIILGFGIIVVLFIIYARTASLGLTPEALLVIEKVALIFYIILILAIGAIAIGLFRYHKRKALENSTGVLGIIASTTFNKKSRRVFLLTFIGYGVFFSLTSGMLVYQPEVVFSYHYGAVIPSVHLTACCGEPGYMPKITAYLSEHIGFQIIPINLVLQIIVSYLVGLNTTLAVSAFTFFKKEGGLGSVGATTGLFIACPTCVGAFSSIFVGSAGAIAFTLAITQLQTMFILITIPILLITPYIMAKKLRIRGGNCTTETKPE